MRASFFCATENETFEAWIQKAPASEGGRYKIKSSGIKPLVHKPKPKAALDAIHGDTAEEFGVEVGGFLRHDFVGGGDLDDFFDVDGIEEEGDLGAAGVHGGDGGGGFALVREIHFLGSGLQGDAESRFENAVMEQNDVEFALQRRDAVEKLAEVGARAQLEEVKGALGFGAGRKSSDGTMSGGVGEPGQELFAGSPFFGVIGERKNF